MDVNWLPMAFDNKTAATDESTPPDKAHKTLDLMVIMIWILLELMHNKDIMRN